jgi:hypothetical protein
MLMPYLRSSELRAELRRGQEVPSRFFTRRRAVGLANRLRDTSAVNDPRQGAGLASGTCAWSSWRVNALRCKGDLKPAVLSASMAKSRNVCLLSLPFHADLCQPSVVSIAHDRLSFPA